MGCNLAHTAKLKSNIGGSLEMALTKNVKPISTSPTSDQDIDGLLSGIAWASSNVTYSFPDKASDYGGSINGFRQFLPAQQTAVETILASIAAVAAITFSELSGDQDKDARSDTQVGKQRMPMLYIRLRGQMVATHGSPPRGTTTIRWSGPGATPGSCTKPVMRLGSNTLSRTA